MKKSNNTAIIGLHIGHNSSACLLINGKIISACEEERFVRDKSFNGFPENSFNYCVSKIPSDHETFYALTFSIDEGFKEWFSSISVVFHKFGYRGLFFLVFSKFEFLFKIVSFGYYPKFIIKFLVFHFLRMKGIDPSKLYFFDHHFCHAASAYYCAPFKSDLVFVLDGKGDGASGGVFKFFQGSLIRLKKFDSRSSFGQPYSAVTKFLGFKMNRHEGKITGLAAHGNPSSYIDIFNELYVEDLNFLISPSLP